MSDLLEENETDVTRPTSFHEKEVVKDTCYVAFLFRDEATHRCHIYMTEEFRIPRIIFNKLEEYQRLSQMYTKGTLRKAGVLDHTLRVLYDLQKDIMYWFDEDAYNGLIQEYNPVLFEMDDDAPTTSKLNIPRARQLMKELQFGRAIPSNTRFFDLQFF